MILFFFSSRRRHTRLRRDWSSDVCSSDLKFGRISKIQLKKKFILRKRTPKHFKGEISERTKKKIREKNKFDFMLYEYIKSNNKTNQKKEYKVQETDEFIV